MAARLKKQLNTKEASAPQAPTVVKNPLASDSTAGKSTSKTTTGIVKKMATTRSPSKRILKRNVQLKAKARTATKLKVNPVSITETLEQNGKKLPAVTKKTILKNGVKAVKARKPRAKKIKEEPCDEIKPQEEVVGGAKKPITKKRIRKPKVPDLIDIKKIKSEPVESTEPENITDKLHDLISEAVQTSTIKKRPKPRKPRNQTATETSTASSIDSTIEDVMNDLSFLIKESAIKKEPDDSMSESSKSDSFKPKKLTKRQRLDILKNEIKKENIENTFSKMNENEKAVINMLDINIKNLTSDSSLMKRRHSIEKFPLSSENNATESLPNLFNQLPRCISPRTSKRNPKIRQSLDGAPKRSSPYTTRSETPNRLLRNAKTSNAKGNLLQGLDVHRRKKRKTSDVTAETGSKQSEYDSDSSFSDLASHCSEKETDVCKTDENLLTDDLNIESKSDQTTQLVLKRTLSSECQESEAKPQDVDIVDTNSNVCISQNKIKQTIDEDDENLVINPSEKVPEKSFILTSMKQMFNVEKVEEQPSTLECKVSKFYGKNEQTKMHDDGENKEPTTEIKKDELIEKKEESLPPLEGFDFEEELSRLIEPKESVKTYSMNDFSPAPDEALSKHDAFMQDDEEKEAEEQKSFEDIVQDCIDSIGESKTPTSGTEDVGNTTEFSANVNDEEMTETSAVETLKNMAENPILDDTVPVIENMTEGIVADGDVEHLEPPQLECSVEQFGDNAFVNSEKQEIIDSEKIDVDSVFVKDKNSTDEVIEEKNELKENLTEPECDKLPEASENLECSQSKLIIAETTLIAPKVSLPIIQESPEELKRKESILNALGLQSKSAPMPRQSKRERQHKQHDDFYTGTLKTVIKINRDKKKGKSSFKMMLQKNKTKHEGAEQAVNEDAHNKSVAKEGQSISTSKHGKEAQDSAGAHRKTHNSNRSNTEGSTEQTSDGESQAVLSEAAEKALLIPEKASSFSIHPGRLCKDECSYCFGKFGLFDTPCHIAQLKSVERQNKILGTEKHLTRDSCLCDACYRHVDRKANTPSYTNKSFKRNCLVAVAPRQNHCHVLNCNNVSTNILRRKWIMKMRKSITQRINIDLDNPGLHSIPICDEHYTALEHLMICAMCKRHLAKNHIHYLGPEVKEINTVLSDEGIPIQLSDRPVVCKLCKCFTSVILKDPEERPDSSSAFFEEYKKRLLHFNDIVPMDAAEAEEPICIPGKGDKNQEPTKKKKRDRNHSGESKDSNDGENGEEGQNGSQNRLSTDTNNSQSQCQSRSESPEDDEYSGVDYNALIPAVNLECPSDNENSKKELSLHQQQQMQRRMLLEMHRNKMARLESMEVKSLRAVRHHKPNDLAVQKLGQNPSISLRPAYQNYQENLSGNSQLSVRQLFPGEEELPLSGHIDFNNVKERTTEGWEKCSSTIQYDEETKLLWQELQKPYGNQSSFLRHLILLEKYFRNGDLMLSPHANHHAINYRESVMNRLRAYDNIPSNAPPNVQPISMMPFNKMQRSQSGIVTSFHASVPERLSNGAASGHSVTISQIPSNGTSGGSVSSKPTPITIQQLNKPPLLPTNTILQNLSANQKSKSGAPPGLISLQPGTTRPATNPTAMGNSPGKQQPQSQKIKFPITKNWRPNLIPIDPTKKQERKTGLVQVISGGKPYHITLEDYKKMCAIKRSFEAKQKRLQEQQKKQLQDHNNATQQVTLTSQSQMTVSSGGSQLQGALMGNTPQQSGTTAVLAQQHNSILKHIIPKKGGGMIISKSGGTCTETKQIIPQGAVVSVTPSVTLTGIPSGIIPITTSTGIPVTLSSSGGDDNTSGNDQNCGESILDKLDKTVEKVGPADRRGPIPRLPASLTVIPQTVRKAPGHPPSPVLMITKQPLTGPINSNGTQPASTVAPSNQS